MTAIAASIPPSSNNDSQSFLSKFFDTATTAFSHSLKSVFQGAVDATKVIGNAAFDFLKTNPILTAAVIDFGVFGGAGTTMLAQELAGAASGLIVDASAQVAEVAKDAAGSAFTAATDAVGTTPEVAGRVATEAIKATPLGMMVNAAMELQNVLGLRP